MGADHVVRLGDCLEGMRGLADKSVDHVICDPPYSERVHRRLGSEGRSDGAATRDALTFGHLDDETAAMVAREICRVARRWLLIFGDEFTFFTWMGAIEAAGGEYVRAGAWVKPAPMPQMSGDRPGAGFEKIVVAHVARESGRLRWNGGGRPAVYNTHGQESGTKREHPTQKPVALMEALVHDFTDPGELVLDPFAGSCSTGVACKRLGRRFLGFEKDPRYFEIGRRRLENASEQMGLWPGAA